MRSTHRADFEPAASATTPAHSVGDLRELWGARSIRFADSGHPAGPQIAGGGRQAIASRLTGPTAVLACDMEDHPRYEPVGLLRCLPEVDGLEEKVEASERRRRRSVDCRRGRLAAKGEHEDLAATRPLR
jgi:hypothetical protein